MAGPLAVLSNRILCVFRCSSSFRTSVVECPRYRHYGTRVREVGRVQEIKKADDPYLPGQMFVHRLFGYRGVILFPWMAKVEDKTMEDSLTGVDDQEHKTEDILGRTDKLYYQVLIDTRDLPTTADRLVMSEYFLLGQSAPIISQEFDTISHEDALPYMSTERTTMENQFFLRFFGADPGKDPPVEPTDALREWKNMKMDKMPSLNVYKKTTANIRVTVIPFYMGFLIYGKQERIYYWTYHIRLENVGEDAVRLERRMWKILSQSSHLQNVNGNGVVGMNPVLSKGQQVFQYNSHVKLKEPCGCMWGRYVMSMQSNSMTGLKHGDTFTCDIPRFQLVVNDIDP